MIHILEYRVILVIFTRGAHGGGTKRGSTRGHPSEDVIDDSSPTQYTDSIFQSLTIIYITIVNRAWITNTTTLK
jgi:hypothetical protein